MENALYIGLSRQIVLQHQMDLVANNIANVNTPGYRGQTLVFREELSKPQGMKDPISLVMDYGQFDSTEPGPVKTTGNPLDVALEGPGFFGVVTPAGTQYTRGGNFTLNAQGQIITSSGSPVASAGGGPIVVPQGVKEIIIGKDGTVMTDKGTVGQLMVREFDNVQDLTPQGHGLYKASTPGRAATDTTVNQGLLEGSNVQPVVEMTRMIDVLREYQSVQRMLQNEHDRQRTAIQKLTRAGE